jgi:hypothetical protein
MMETASLVIPSPNTIEKSFGYSSNLIIVTAATASEEHKSDDIRSTSLKLNLNDIHSLLVDKESLLESRVVFGQNIKLHYQHC